MTQILLRELERMGIVYCCGRMLCTSASGVELAETSALTREWAAAAVTDVIMMTYTFAQTNQHPQERATNCGKINGKYANR